MTTPNGRHTESALTDKGAGETESPDSRPAADTGEQQPPREIGGRAGPDPVRYGDWEKQGRCIDF